jgi:hypothetical protein
MVNIQAMGRPSMRRHMKENRERVNTYNRNAYDRTEKNGEGFVIEFTHLS